MKLLKNVVGIDVSKDELEVLFLQGSGDKTIVKGTRKFSNDHAGFTRLVQWSQGKCKNEPVHFIMEATGVYHENATYFLYENLQPVYVVLANKIKHFAKSLNVKTKTDKSDAKVIAQYGLRGPCQAWKPVTCELKSLRMLCRERLSCKKQIAALKNQLHALHYAKETINYLIEMKEEQISRFELNIVELDKIIRQTVEQDNEFAKKIHKLETIKSVGFITAVTVVCETNGFENFTGIRKVVSYSGLDIRHHQSGVHVGKSKITKQGNARIRQCLYMPALNAIQHNEPIKRLHERIVERNPTIKQKGVVAAMRKLLILMFVLWKKNEAFNPDFVWNAQ